ncbi:MAG: chromosome segregation SMC family protein [Brevinema sp.]
MASYLKSLELQGFKSFGGKTRVEFAEGITGIVGPNGCGKSNVVEAVKWVLGEQSAKSLRGDKMQDIIFNGTTHRSPAGMAEAILTFNNQQQWLPLEYPEVSISRRIFRSGEGQYYINGARSRLKDNLELFLDTGVGRDSYAIFEQGKIDRLLSESAEDRRVLFEDFAGISKFKFRKEEAERKLAAARENLERLQETLDRLEKEIATLELQAQDAESYKETSTRLGQAELKFGAARLQNMRREIEKRQNERESLKSALNPLSEDLTRIENEMSKSEQGSGDKERLFGEMNEKFHALEKELAQIKTQRTAAERRMEDNNKRLVEISIRSKQDRERLEDGEEELSEKRDAVFDAEKKEAAARAVLAKAEELQNAIKAETEALEQALLQRSQELGFPRAINRSDSENIRRDIAEFKGRVFQYESEEISQQDILKTKQQAMKAEETQIESLKSLLDQAEKLAKTCTDAKNEAIRMVSERERLIKECELKQKSLLEESKSLDKRIMTALERSLEHIRAFRKEQPLLTSAIKAAFDAVEKAAIEGKVDLNLIQTLKIALQDSEIAYERFAGSLFGEDFTAKLALLDENDALWELLEKERATLDSEKQILEDAIQKEAQAIADQNVAENNFKNSEREFRKLQSEAEQARLATDRAKSDLFNARQSLEQAENKLNLLEDAIRNYDEGHASLRDRRQEINDKVSDARVSYTGFEAQAKALRGDIRSLEIRLDDIRRSLNNADSDESNLKQTDEQLKEEIEELNETVDELTPEIARLKKDMASIAEEIQEISKAKRALESYHKDALEKYNKLRMRESEMEGVLSERIKVMHDVEESLKEQFQREDLSSIELTEEDTLEKLQISIKALKEQLFKMGDVNMMAVEQFHAAKERYTTLTHQKEDIEAATTDTETLIAETNAESSEKFIKAFEDIRKSFRDLFAQLFDGGRADLLLTNKEDPLSSGIDIMAEPPGQKFQNVSLLSGGQRAMVAIAVIFSMLKLKPTPFIILDEIDAPLDDENIERFKKLLSRFKDTGQFVIVSHSKSTLEVCDALFGVTMEELGCSKVLSVAFDEADELIFK